MSFSLNYNSSTSGADVRAHIEKMPAASPKEFWSDSLVAWTTVAATPTFADRSNELTEGTAYERSVSYEGVAVFNSGYTGEVRVGYTDNSDGAVLETELRYFKNGAEVSFAVANDRTNTEVPKPFVFVLSRRSDGTIVANDDIHLSSVDSPDIAFETEHIISDGASVEVISNIAVSPSGSMAVTSKGTRDTQAILTVDGNQAAATDYTVSCDILTTNGVTLQCVGTIQVLATI